MVPRSADWRERRGRSPPRSVTAWANTYYQQTQQLLAPLARSGVRIFLFNFGILQERIAANPGQYGFASAGGCQATLGVAGCLAASAGTVQNSFFYFNTVHPTGAAMALIATYMANQIDAPTTVVPQGRITTSIATNFTASVLGRLDAYRTFQAYRRRPGAWPVPCRPRRRRPHARRKAGGRSTARSITCSGSLDRQFLAAGYDYRRRRRHPRDRVSGRSAAAPRRRVRLLRARRQARRPERPRPHQRLSVRRLRLVHRHQLVRRRARRLRSPRLRSRPPGRDRRHSRQHQRRHFHGGRQGAAISSTSDRSAPDRSPASPTPAPSSRVTPRPATASSP